MVHKRFLLSVWYSQSLEDDMVPLPCKHTHTQTIEQKQKELYSDAGCLQGADLILLSVRGQGH